MHRNPLEMTEETIPDVINIQLDVKPRELTKEELDAVLKKKI